MGELGSGLYEVLVTEGLRSVLDAIEPDLASTRKLNAAEAPDRVALHLARQIEQALSEVGESDRIEVAVAVARALLERLAEMRPATDLSEQPDPAAVFLHETATAAGRSAALRCGDEVSAGGHSWRGHRRRVGGGVVQVEW